jgi:drug/metabolite transporter (DMT)-like permease
MQWDGILRTSFAVGLFASAFVVFEAWCQNIDSMVALTWFSLFAFLALTWLEGWPTLRTNVLADKRTLAKVVGCALCFALYFMILLLTLGRTNAVYVLTMLLLQPITVSIAAIIYLEDQVRSKVFYFGGLILTLIGLVLFRFEAWQSASASVNFWDIAMLLVVLFVSVGTVVRTELTRADVITVSCVFQVSFAFTVLFGFIAAISRGKMQELVSVPFRWEVVPLIYIGIVPTAIANARLQEYNNRYSVPFVQSVEALKPIFGIMISFVLGLFVTIKQPDIDFLKGSGIAIAIIGVCAAVRLGRPHRKQID